MARPKLRDRQVGTYFITTAIWERRSLFRKHEWAAVVEQKILQYRDKGFYPLHRYVIMPDHIHVLLTPSQSVSIERTVQHIKGGSSREIGARFQSQFPVWHPGFTEHRIRLVARSEGHLFGSAHGKHRLDPWHLTSGAEAQCD